MITDSTRVLALDVRSRSFGFVVFEGPNEILDWGARSFRSSTNVVKTQPRVALGRLLDEFSPGVLVLNAAPPDSANLRRSMIAVARRAAKSCRVRCRTIDRRFLMAVFRKRNKGDIAEAVAARFPELAVKLPPRRKCWQSEDYRTSIFDASAMGIVHFHSACKMGRNSPRTPQLS